MTEGDPKAKFWGTLKWRLKVLAWAIAGMAALSATVWAVWSNAERVPKRYLESAEQKWRADDYLGAVREYEKITEEFPRSRLVPEALFWSGVIYYLYLDDPSKSVDFLQKTIRLTAPTPNNPHALSARRYLAEVYEKKYNKYREAIAEYEKIMELSGDPDQALESQFKIGELYSAVGNVEQARTEWDLLIKRDPKSRWAPSALYRQGSSYFIEGRCKEALIHYRRLVAEYSDSDMVPFALFRTANCLEEGGERDAALKLYRELQGRYPNKELVELKIKQIERGGPKQEERVAPPVSDPAAPSKLPAPDQ
ncbi:MAG: tetratricopeptide repeat protein [Nitrospirae bacterium]|nr:tetratricopeptide repeat protein [Candidatus Manganitrophaceae bacterium]